MSDLNYYFCKKRNVPVCCKFIKMCLWVWYIESTCILTRRRSWNQNFSKLNSCIFWDNGEEEMRPPDVRVPSQRPSPLRICLGCDLVRLLNWSLHTNSSSVICLLWRCYIMIKHLSHFEENITRKTSYIDLRWNIIMFIMECVTKGKFSF